MEKFTRPIHKADVKIGATYLTNQGVRVRIESECQYGGWYATKVKTGRQVRIKSASKLRKEVSPTLHPSPAVPELDATGENEPYAGEERKETQTVLTHNGQQVEFVCYDCGQPISQIEYKRGQSDCCGRGIIPKSEYGERR